MTASRYLRATSTRAADRAWQVVAGQEPPTVPIGLRTQPSGMDRVTAHGALDLALRIGESLLALGASAADATATVLRVAAAHGLTKCQVDVTFASITVSWDPGNAVPLTALRIVPSRALDCIRLQGVMDLARAVSAGELALEEAHRRLDQVVSAPPTYRREVGSGPAVASGVAAVVIGFCGAVLTERLRIPPLLVAVRGIVPLLPGLAIYHGLFAVVVDADVERGLGTLVRAAATGLALAAGVALGEYLGTPLGGGRDRFDRRVRLRATTTD